MVFVDHTIEYPWTQKSLFEFEDIGISDRKRVERKFYGSAYLKIREIFQTKTPKYNINQKIPLFGFPHYRAWDDINNYVNYQNTQNNEDFGYSTNEVHTISQWYMDAKLQADEGYYLIGVKKPLSFSNDYKFPQIGNKEMVHEITNGEETVVRIYRVEP